jgi:hypothetical protein
MRESSGNWIGLRDEHATASDSPEKSAAACFFALHNETAGFCS